MEVSLTDSLSKELIEARRDLAKIDIGKQDMLSPQAQGVGAENSQPHDDLKSSTRAELDAQASNVREAMLTINAFEQRDDIMAIAEEMFGTGATENTSIGGPASPTGTPEEAVRSVAPRTPQNHPGAKSTVVNIMV